MGSHKAGSTNLSPLPPCLSPSLSFLLHSLQILRGSSACPPPTLGQEEAKGWEVAGVGVPPLPHAWWWGKRGSAGSGLPVLSCERQTFGRVITRRTALGVISDSCLFEVFGAHSLYRLRLPPLRLMFRLHLHEGGSCSCQHKQGACEVQVCTCLCFTDAQNSFCQNIQERAQHYDRVSHYLMDTVDPFYYTVSHYNFT